MAELWQSFLEAPFWVHAVTVVGLVILVWLLWQLLGRGPRRRRTLKKVRNLLAQGHWLRALELLPKAGSAMRRSEFWNGQFLYVEAQCYDFALADALRDNDFELAADHAAAAARCRNKDELSAKAVVIEALLQEVRRMFAEGASIHDLVARAFRIQPSCCEAHFWQGLSQLREGPLEAAMKSLEAARGSAVDPPLYLGALCLRSGKPKEALRYLTEANRIDARSPFVGCALGAAMVASGGDPGFAVRALTRALGPQGFERWSKDPARAWVEGLPENASYVQRLAKQHAFRCPLWGLDARALRHEGYLALGQAHFRLNNHAEARAAFEKLIHETAPTYAALRGLGFALARLGQYDEAFTHLKTAHDMEQNKDRATAGYLALCGAKAKPAQEEDKARNIAWAIRLVTRFEALGDAEWIMLIGQVFDEARQHGVPLTEADQLFLCDHLASISATDPRAADAYHHLMATFTPAVKPVYAWLYGRAAQQHGHAGPASLSLFGRIFADAPAARTFYEANGWSLEDVELTYLKLAAEFEPGAFPKPLGADYPQRGETLLLERARQQERAGDLDGSLTTSRILLALSPASPVAHDRAAQLYYRKDDRDQALAVLDQWQASNPQDPTPLVRSAVLHHELGNAGLADERIDRALGLANGQRYADIAYLGARLSLKAGWGKSESQRFERPLNLLERCLQAHPGHAKAQSLLAALRWTVGDLSALAAQARDMTEDGKRTGYFGALANLVAGNHDRTRELCKVSKDNRNGEHTTTELDSELSYLAAWASAKQGELDTAVRFLTDATREGPSAKHARALAGKLCLLQGQTEDALSWWKSLDPESQKRWRVDEAMAGTVFLTALENLTSGQYEQAAERIREAGRLGYRDRRLGSLLTLALVKAGQQLIYELKAQ